MLFGLLVSEPSLARLSNLDKPSYLQFLASAAISEDIEVVVFTSSKVCWKNRTVSGLVFNCTEGAWKSGCSSFPDVVYDRATLDFREKDKIMAKHTRNRLIKEYNIPFLNNINFFDKWKTYQALVIHPEVNKFLPDTQLYSQTGDLLNFLSRYEIVYVKPCVGSNGRNVFQVKHWQDGKYLFRYREKGKNSQYLLTPEEFHNSVVEDRLAGKSLIMQQGIDLETLDEKPFDMRVRVQKNGTGNWELVSNWVRIAAPDSVVTNSSNGGSGGHFSKFLPFIFSEDVSRINTEIESLVYTACRHLEKNFGPMGDLGFDIALDRAGKLWVLEVNAKPTNVWHFDGSGENRFINPVRYARYLWESSQKSPN